MEEAPCRRHPPPGTIPPATRCGRNWLSALAQRENVCSYGRARSMEKGGRSPACPWCSRQGPPRLAGSCLQQHQAPRVVPETTRRHGQLPPGWPSASGSMLRESLEPTPCHRRGGVAVDGEKTLSRRRGISAQRRFRCAPPRRLCGVAVATHNRRRCRAPSGRGLWCPSVTARGVGDALPSFIFSFVVAEDEHELRSRRSNQRQTSPRTAPNVAGFLGYPQPGGGTHPPLPNEGVLGGVLGSWANLALR